MLPPPQLGPVVFANEAARAQYEFFRGLNHPHHGLVARVDVAGLRAFAKTRGLSFNRVVVHAVSAAANAVPELRRRVHGETLCEYDVVHPSYTVPQDGAAGFSFCTVPFVDELAAFETGARAIEAERRAAPSFEDERGRDDFLFLSAVPWVHFTGIQHAMGYHPGDSVPRITWGKVIDEGAHAWMPVAIQAHHACTDGRVLGAFYEGLEARCSGQ